jgi:uncharacterized membrane protein YebE (DUF533 family)
MKLIRIQILGALVALTSLSSCASGPNAQTGAVLGGLGGAALGGIIGHQSGRGLEGAAIGGALGAVGGNAVGNSQDQRNGYRQNQYYNGRPAPYQQPYQQGGGYYR